MAKAVGVEDFAATNSGINANADAADQRHGSARRLDEMANALHASEAGPSARTQISGKFSLAAAGASGASHSVDYDGRKVDAGRNVVMGTEESAQLQAQSAGESDAAFGSLNRSLV